MNLTERTIIGRYIMKGIHTTRADTFQFHWDLLRTFVTSLNLPSKKCSDCKETEMSFFEWHMAQGMCAICAAKYRDEWESTDV